MVAPAGVALYGASRRGGWVRRTGAALLEGALARLVVVSLPFFKGLDVVTKGVNHMFIALEGRLMRKFTLNPGLDEFPLRFPCPCTNRLQEMFVKAADFGTNRIKTFVVTQLWHRSFSACTML